MSDALNVKTRIKLIEEIKQTFWKNYLNALAGNSHLFKYPCWYAQSRKPHVGDIVLVLYKTRVSESYRVGKILQIDKDCRNLELSVSPPQVGDNLEVKSSSKMLIPIQRTILLYSPHDEPKKPEVEHFKVKPGTARVKEKVKIKYQDDISEIKDVIKNKRGRPVKTPSSCSNQKYKK